MILGILVIGILVTGYTRSVVKTGKTVPPLREKYPQRLLWGRLRNRQRKRLRRRRAALCRNRLRQIRQSRKRNKRKKRRENPLQSLSLSLQWPGQQSRKVGERPQIHRADSPCEGGLYRQRLNDLDAQIQKMQEQERDPNVYSIKTSAETEVKMWDRGLNAVYNALLGILPQEEAEELAKEQKEWLINRETAAGQSGKAEGVGSISYAASLVDLTRNRAYELADRYEKEACGPQDAENESDTAVLP